MGQHKSNDSKFQLCWTQKTSSHLNFLAALRLNLDETSQHGHYLLELQRMIINDKWICSALLCSLHESFFFPTFSTD